jgi:hypothetical protein
MAKGYHKKWRNGYKAEPKEPISTELALTSGFVVRIRPLPPYSIDLIEENFPLPEYPKRKISLASGDVVDWEYKPPDIEPEEEGEDRDLYVLWHLTDQKRQEITKIRHRAKMNFLLSNCVDIVVGPVDIDDPVWIERVEAMYDDYKVPEHSGRKRLVFIKTQVVSTPGEMEMILQMSVAQEVSMQGIMNALQGFRNQVGE